MLDKTIVPHVQSEMIFRVTHRPFRDAVITKHRYSPSIEPSREANNARNIEQAKYQSFHVGLKAVKVGGSSRHNHAQKMRSGYLVSLAIARKARSGASQTAAARELTENEMERSSIEHP